MLYAYVYDKFVLEDQAFISINERGFLYGDGVFETIRVVNSIPYLWPSHLNRLQLGLSELRITIPNLAEHLINLITEIIKLNKITNAIIRVNITRGIGSEGYAPLKNIKPNLVIQTREILADSDKAIDLFLLENAKTGGVNYKSVNSAPYVISKIIATENNYTESLIIDKEGYICETSSANIFWFKSNKLYTPSLELGIVAGVMRQKIIDLELCEIVIGKFNRQNLCDADEIFISNISRIITPVKNISGLVSNKVNYEKALQLKGFISHNINNIN